MTIKIRKGLTIPLKGKPTQTVSDGNDVRSVALLGHDYLGLKPKMRTAIGDIVRCGDPLFVDKRDPDVPYTAPGSGTVVAINRGERRALLSVVIELNDSADLPAEFPELAGEKHDSLSEADVRDALIRSGFWTAFRTRPFSRVPHSETSPSAIFVTAIDTNPLAADPAVIVMEDSDAFLIGLSILSRLTTGQIHVCTGVGWSLNIDQGERIRQTAFSGPHPTGLVGTHIHHLDPVGANYTVWHIGYQDAMAIGALFRDGQARSERIIALGGTAFTSPRLVRSRCGASITELVAGELADTGGASNSVRLISGSVLSGRRAGGPEAFVGRYHMQVGAIPNAGTRKRLFGWLPFLSGGYTHSGLLSRRQGATARTFTTASHGPAASMIGIEGIEDVMPLDILPAPLLKALLIGDTDQAQALGALELDAEDLSLCSFLCPGKSDYGRVLQTNLARIEKDG